MKDVLVVGSGASAVHAAWPLVQAGLHVLMLDVGFEDERYHANIPAKSFEQLRREDNDQHRYFLGDDFEGIPFGPVRVGAQLTPPRQHISREAAKLLPLVVDNFHAMQSLALGGLGAGWGAAVPPFTDEDMVGWPITRAELQPHYDAVTARIGICGPKQDDDLSPFLGKMRGMLPPPRLDSNAHEIFRRYRKHRRWMQNRGLHMGQPRLAMATETFRDRGPLKYYDMEFWADRDRAVYRPKFTLDELKRYSNFTYLSGHLARTFVQQLDGTVELEALELKTKRLEKFRARRLILAAGTLGTARIVLRSFGMYNVEVPLVTNPYVYYPCVVFSRLGKRTRDRRHSLTQLMMFFDCGGSRGSCLQAQIYSYRSLMNFKLVKESPLPFPQSIRLMQMLQPYFVIVGVHHEDLPGPDKYLRIEQRGGGEEPVLRVHYEPSEREIGRRRARERTLMSLFPWLGAMPIRRIDPGHGSSIHYAGSLPMTNQDRPLTTHPDGRLRGAESVRIADGAAFPHLPAKGLTYTLMANANRVGEMLLQEIK